MSRERFYPDTPETFMSPKQARKHLINPMGYNDQYILNPPASALGVVHYYEAVSAYRQQDESNY